VAENLRPRGKQECKQDCSANGRHPCPRNCNECWFTGPRRSAYADSPAEVQGCCHPDHICSRDQGRWRDAHASRHSGHLAVQSVGRHRRSHPFAKACPCSGNHTGQRWVLRGTSCDCWPAMPESSESSSCGRTARRGLARTTPTTTLRTKRFAARQEGSASRARATATAEATNAWPVRRTPGRAWTAIAAPATRGRTCRCPSSARQGCRARTRAATPASTGSRPPQHARAPPGRCSSAGRTTTRPPSQLCRVSRAVRRLTTRCSEGVYTGPTTLKANYSSKGRKTILESPNGVRSVPRTTRFLRDTSYKQCGAVSSRCWRCRALPPLRARLTACRRCRIGLLLLSARRLRRCRRRGRRASR